MIEFNAETIRYFSWHLRFFQIKKADGTFVAKKSNISALTRIDTGTRINGPITIKGIGSCEIGKYCAIGSNVRIITSNHNTTCMNLQLSLQHSIGVTANIEKIGNVSIGHNVWIGDSVIILPGVTIGNGVVLGAGSVITKDVLPYAIAAGNPAKVIKYRFNDERIVEIENLQWWDWSLEKMRQNRQYFEN